MSHENMEYEFDDLFQDDDNNEFDDVVIEKTVIHEERPTDVKKSSIGTLR